MIDEKKILEEAGLDPEHWHPIDVAPIQPGQINRLGQEGSPGFFQGSIPYAAQHDTTFVETSYRSPTAPQLSLMPLSPSGQPGINSSGNNQATEALNKVLPGVIKNGATFPATLDSVKNSQTSAKVSISAVNQNGAKGLVGALAPAQTGFLSQGSTPFAIQATPFSYTAIATSAVISWTGVQVLRGDGTLLALPDGSVTINGLTATTTYFAYPYLNDLALFGAPDYQVVSFLTGLATSVGTPAILYPNQLPALGQAQSLQHRISLNSGAITVITPSGGTPVGGSSGGTGGSGGGSGNKYTD